jgi:hypothetical protein
MPNAFARAFELRNDPLLADIYEDITNLEKLQYIGPEMDRVNLRNDISHWKGDFKKAFQVAKKDWECKQWKDSSKCKLEPLGISKLAYAVCGQRTRC